MKEFNYKRAHAEWAVPGYLALPGQVKALYGRLQRDYANVHQDSKLGLPWLPGFEAEFKAVDPETLAWAAHFIYGLGHWDSKDSGNPVKDAHGGYWKFEWLAKQSLIARGWDKYADYDKYGLSKGAFMDHKEGTELDHEELADQIAPLTLPEFKTVKITTVNHKPDVFCIGPKHFTDYGTIDVKAAPCANCGESHDRHTCDTVLFVRRLTCADSKLSEAEQQNLRRLKVLLEAHKIDGVAFVR